MLRPSRPGESVASWAQRCDVAFVGTYRSALQRACRAGKDPGTAQNAPLVRWSVTAVVLVKEKRQPVEEGGLVSMMNFMIHMIYRLFTVGALSLSLSLSCGVYELPHCQGVGICEIDLV